MYYVRIRDDTRRYKFEITVHGRGSSHQVTVTTTLRDYDTIQRFTSHTYDAPKSRYVLTTPHFPLCCLPPRFTLYPLHSTAPEYSTSALQHSLTPASVWLRACLIKISATLKIVGTWLASDRPYAIRESNLLASTWLALASIQSDWRRKIKAKAKTKTKTKTKTTSKTETQIKTQVKVDDEFIISRLPSTYAEQRQKPKQKQK